MNINHVLKKVAIAFGIVVALVFASAFLTDYLLSNRSGSAACQKTLDRVLSSIEGVKSFKLECSLQFGGGWQRAELKIDANNDDEAQTIAIRVMRAYANDPDVDDSWATPSIYVLNDGSTISILKDFYGTPSVRAVRDKYNIHP